ncbi:hypothetical protein [Lishizhenia sp.]|uniref:hypothetical protein n=1 Tax=Lishizhenia sp. TaxID=2497594 RepID=UPI00299CEFE1|nr:hypothetical protein [Lishizhenia sp.]MDX1444831.1 hypothetical protein [Lishizhenia sp.]
MDILVSAHSGLRYIALLLLVIAVVNAIGNKTKGEYLKKDKMINLFTMIIMHIQLLMGLVLYVNFWISKVPAGAAMKMPFRFYTVEHIFMMIIAIVLITVGRKKAEKEGLAGFNKHRLIRNFYGIALLLIFFAIPWPFLREGIGAGWF